MLTRLSADGCVPFATEEVGCCPPPLCGNSLCETFCAFISILPSGPLWDYWKAAAISYFKDSDDPARCPLIQNPACPSLILHAIYCVMKLKMLTYTAIWPAFRESDPMTALTTLDDHLARLQWQDCYTEHCRTVLGSELTPYEIWGECGPVFCKPDFPPELECAVKHNIAVALTRANMGVIKNLCGLNWIIEPLGASLTPIYPLTPSIPPTDPCASMCPDDVTFQLCNTQDWIEGCMSGDPCETAGGAPRVPAFWERGCDVPAGLPEQIWPAVLAAECIVRSMLPPSCVNNIVRCC